MPTEISQNQKYYSISIRSHNFVIFHKSLSAIKKHWCECGGKIINNTIFQGNDSTLTEFYLTFTDTNLIITFTELTITKVNI